ncbi:uncharacterized protein LOC132555131 [Ylistrum balloti]|uniref:uncharacterized protein LOC132555131 n=1 Tax=Ylistrum balloti TaxID=509963 RepID=UPI0029057EE7|nr:uncharacterized protein LOC132555131 [Ylistrum balloti]
MWIQVVQLVTLIWVGLASTAGFQMFPNTQDPYNNNDVYSQRQTYRQTMTPRLVQPASFSANFNQNNKRFSQRAAQKSTSQRTTKQKVPNKPRNPKTMKKTTARKPKVPARQSRYETMMARRRIAAMHYRLRAQTCDPQMSLYCRCSRLDCLETEIQAFPCGFMWTGRRCCKRWWAMKCMMSELMSETRPTGGRQSQGQMSLQQAMMTPMLMEVFEM